MLTAILVSILGLAFIVVVCTMGIVNQIRSVYDQLDLVIAIQSKERTANVRQRLGM